MTTFTTQKSFNVDIDTSVQDSNIISFTSDYVLNIDLGSLSANTDSLFTTATYVQNSNDPNTVDVILLTNNDMINTLIGSSRFDTNLSTNILGVSTAPVSVQMRLLEIIALKLFDRADIRAPIKNDSTFLGFDITTAVSTVLNGDANFIFGEYVAAGKTTQNDVGNTPVTFNFSDISIQIPVYLQGKVNLMNLMNADGANSDSNSLTFITGNTRDGSSINRTDGTYKIPIGLKFYNKKT